jgi:hypothetical protein
MATKVRPIASVLKTFASGSLSAEDVLNMDIPTKALICAISANTTTARSSTDGFDRPYDCEMIG